MSKLGVSNLPALDIETDMLISGLSTGDIEALEMEFENLCDLSFESKVLSGRNSNDELSEGTELSPTDAVIPPASKSTPKSSYCESSIHKSEENSSKSHSSRNDEVFQDDDIKAVLSGEDIREKPIITHNTEIFLSEERAAMKGGARAALRGERSDYISSRQDHTPTNETYKCSSKSRFSASNDKANKKRSSTHSDESDKKESSTHSTQSRTRRSKINAPDDSHVGIETRTTDRLSRRRISRDSDDDTIKPRLTSRRLNSADDSDNSSEKVMVPARTELRSTRLGMKERPVSALCTYHRDDEDPIITRSQTRHHREEPIKVRDDSHHGRIRNYCPTLERDVRVSRTRRKNDTDHETYNKDTGLSRSSFDPLSRKKREKKSIIESHCSSGSSSPRSTPDRELKKPDENTLTTRQSSSRTSTCRSKLTPVKEDAQNTASKTTHRRGTGHKDGKSPTRNSDHSTRRMRGAEDKTTLNRSESNEEERKELVSSMHKHLDELKDLRKSAVEKRKSDSSGDEKPSTRLRRGGREIEHLQRPKIQSGSKKVEEKNRTDSEDVHANVSASKTSVTAISVEPPQPIVEIVEIEKPTCQASVETSSKSTRSVLSSDSDKVLTTLKQTTDLNGNFRRRDDAQRYQEPSPTIPKVSEVAELRSHVAATSLIKELEEKPVKQSNDRQSDTGPGEDLVDSYRNNNVPSAQIARTKISEFEAKATTPFDTNFCVVFDNPVHKSSEQKHDPKEETPERNSIRSEDWKTPSRKAIRRSGSLRTVKDRSWIREGHEHNKTSDRNVEIPRCDSLRSEDQSWIRGQVDTPSKRDLHHDMNVSKRDSYTSEEKIILRSAKRDSVDLTANKETGVLADPVDAEIKEIEAREGNKTSDDKTRLSIADKLKIFSDSPQDETPKRPSVIRRRQRYKAHRFQTQPITLDEVEKAGKITPRPVSLAVTDAESKELQKVLGGKQSSPDKTLQQGPEIELPKGDDIEFFASTDAKPINIKVDSDAFDDVFLCSQDLLDIKRRPKPKRRVAGKKSVNPIKALQARDDLQDAYTEVKVVDVKKIQRQQIDTKTGYAEAALQGLASIENFNKVSLKKATQQKKSTDPFSSLMLVLVKGRHDVQVRLVEPNTSSLCSGDCYVIITPEKVFCWLGKNGNVIEKARAQEFASQIYKHKDMGFKGDQDVVLMEEANSQRKKEFWDLLGGFGPYSETEIDDELYEYRLCEMNIVYQLDKETLVPDPTWCGRPLKYALLQDHTKVIVLDFGTELYIWNGPKCSFEDRKRALKLAKLVWDNGVEYKESPNPILPFKEGEGGFKGQRPEWCIFGKINQNMETQLFKGKFYDWPQSNRIITVKTDKKEDREQVELTPCDVSYMLKANTEPVTLQLEGTNVGRGRHWSEKKDDFVSKDFDIATIKATCWLVREYDHHVMDVESYGQFHEAHTYVVRWQYMVIPAVKTLKGGASRQSLTGRERCAYFFWQGRNSTVNEKGASAMMTVELDEERGPQVRVIQGQEPPAFTQLFDGKMIVHLGRRDDTCVAWKLYIVRNEIACEVYLLEVLCLYSSLRSRSSFVLLNTENGRHYVWHGAKSPEQTRECARQVSRGLSREYPKEIGTSAHASDPVEVMEGAEPSKFYLAFKDIDTHTATLSKDLSFKSKNAPNYKTSPRLFHLTSVSGVFRAMEIVNPSRSQYISPMPFTQEQLYDTFSQPALFILDIGTKLYVWQGWWPDGFEESENVQTGSARARFNKERKLALETALNYCRRKDIDGELILAGCESENFTHLFPTWAIRAEAETNNKEEVQRLAESSCIKELLVSFGKKTYTYEELLGKPDGIEHTKIEAYLADDEFESVFKMTKEMFYDLPSWKRIAMRKAAGLF